MVKNIFFHNGGQRKCIHILSHSNCSKSCFDVLKGRDASYLLLKFGDNLSSRNRDMDKNVILLDCNLERSRSSINFSIRPLLLTYKYTFEVSSKSYCPPFFYGRAIVDRKVARRRKKNSRRNNLMDIDTL